MNLVDFLYPMGFSTYSLSPKSMKSSFCVDLLYMIFYGLISLCTIFSKCMLKSDCFIYWNLECMFYRWNWGKESRSIKNSMHFLETIKSNPKGLTTFGPISNTPAMYAIMYSFKISTRMICLFFPLAIYSLLPTLVLVMHFTTNYFCMYRHK